MSLLAMELERINELLINKVDNIHSKVRMIQDGTTQVNPLDIRIGTDQIKGRCTSQYKYEAN